jgi:protein involved in polysaccharide export with SLBB domain
LNQAGFKKRFAPIFCDMKTTLLKNFAIAFGLIFSSFTANSVAQTTENPPTKKVNFGYSQNPKTKTNKETTANQDKQNSTETTEPTQENTTADNSTNGTIAQKTLEVVKNANKKALAPTESYKVGVGDILFINLQNSSKGSTYFTVLNDGTIDYPLAGEMMSVSGLNTDEIEELLREKVKLYENPQISVKVREYSSHKITVLGLVEKSGEKFIQREAVPLFVVRAEAVVEAKANKVIVRRADSKTEIFDLKDEKTENILIFPNDIVEFTIDNAKSVKNNEAQFFYIGGEIASSGQKDFHDGLTLTQAILASGGLKKESIKKIVIRRKNSDGLLVSTDYNLKLIKDGKIPDPVLQAGDTIEISN